MSDTGRRRDSSAQGGEYSGTSLEVTEQCELLSSRRRLHILRYLKDRPGETVTVSELVSYLQTVENSSPGTDYRLPLRHLHLPKFAEKGVIDYDREKQCLEYYPNQQLEKLLTFVSDLEARNR